MPSSLQLTSCTTCQGQALTGKANHGLLTCTECQGKGMWLEDGQQHQLVYPLAELLRPYHGLQENQVHFIKYAIAALSLGLTAASSIAILLQYSSFNSLFWQQGSWHFLFGLGGLASMYSLTTLQHHETSKLSLHELKAALGEASLAGNIDLAPYFNLRIAHLLKELPTIAIELHSPTISELVLLVDLLRQPRIQVMLARLERSSGELIDLLMRLRNQSTTTVSESFPVDPAVRTRLYLALQEALEHDFPYVDLEDILLSFIQTPGPFAAFFKEIGLEYDEVYAVTRWYAGEQERARQWAFWLERGRARPSGYMNRAWTALPTPFLDHYSQDITQLAGYGRVPTVTVRDKEIEEILQVLGRTQKNSVILVGEPGVGKSAIVGALALRMIEENVPEILKDRRLVSMDLGALMSGGDTAEQNIQTLLEEIEQAGNVILVIPDIQALIGTSGGALDSAVLLSGAINRGEIQVISTASYADYHRYIESNTTFASLLEKVEIKELTPEQTIEVLEEEAPQIEARQNVFLTYPAIEAAVRLAKRYIPDKVLPDSALGLLDEAASHIQSTKSHWVNAQDVEKVIEHKTNIPIQQASAQEAATLLHLEEKLHERIIGQAEAIKAVANALRRARAGLHEDKRPISSFLFIGPTGVGKTETAKALADLYFGGQAPMIRLDMSEYQDNRAIYKLIGAPAADSDSYTEGGSLTQAVREHPFSLILLDELEKAYPDVLNLFLQLLDDGRLTENTGRTVYYNNTIIIATSNAGAADIVKLMQSGVSGDQLSEQVMQLLQKQFRPEFLNRFDAIIPFHALTEPEIEQVVTLMLKQVSEKALLQKITVTFLPETIQKIGQLGYDPLYGARPLRRFIQEKVEALLAEKILDGSLKSGETLTVQPDMIQ